jgi:hypothetical protein
LIAGIEALYAKLFLQVPANLQECLTAFDVNARGSLASWFAAVVLCCSAMASMLVYLIRRHRTDDYRGRYRWWLWLIPLLLVISVNAGTGLHHALSGVLTSLSGAEIAVGGKGWWLLAYAAVFLPIVLQLAMEFWPSRLATAFFCGTICGYAVVAAFELQAVQCATPLATTITHSSILLTAHFGVLLTILAYGRYVYLEAHDAIGERKKWRLGFPRRTRTKRVKRKPEVAESKGDDEAPKESGGPLKRIRVDGSHSKFGQAATSPSKVSVSAASVDTEEHDEDGNSDRRLSKHERKRLRREGLRQ